MLNIITPCFTSGESVEELVKDQCVTRYVAVRESGQKLRNGDVWVVLSFLYFNLLILPHFLWEVWNAVTTGEGASTLGEGMLFMGFPWCETQRPCKIQITWPLYSSFLMAPSSTYSPSVWSEGNLPVSFRRTFRNLPEDVLLIYITETKCHTKQEIGLTKTNLGEIVV